METERRRRPSGHRLSAILITALLAACAGRPPPAPAPAAPEPAAAPPIEAEPPPPPRHLLRIAAVGDMMLGTDYPENILPDDDGVGFLSEVTPLLASADLAFGNLEGVLMDGGEPAKKCSNPRACYLFRSPARYAAYFRAAGFDGLSLANNHARDFGEQGRLASMQHLDDVGIRHSGLEGDFAVFDVDGIKVAFLAYAVTRNSNLALDYDLARATVAGFAGTNDIVVVSFHAGAEGRNVERLPFAEEEYFNEPRGDVVKFARAVVDAGADFVFGHGPHVVRAMENYNGRLIAYSLGNFATYYGISVEGIRGIAPVLSVTLDEDGQFVTGRIDSTIQVRPAGPSIDPESAALRLVRRLSIADFGTPGLRFLDDGTIEPATRDLVRTRAPAAPSGRPEE